MSEGEITQTVHIGANVPAQLRDELQEIAAAHDRTFAAELRQAIRFYVDSHAQNSSAA